MSISPPPPPQRQMRIPVLDHMIEVVPVENVGLQKGLMEELDANSQRGWTLKDVQFSGDRILYILVRPHQMKVQQAPPGVSLDGLQKKG